MRLAKHFSIGNLVPYEYLHLPHLSKGGGWGGYCISSDEESSVVTVFVVGFLSWISFYVASGFMGRPLSILFLTIYENAR